MGGPPDGPLPPVLGSSKEQAKRGTTTRKGVMGADQRSEACHWGTQQGLHREPICTPPSLAAAQCGVEHRWVSWWLSTKQGARRGGGGPSSGPPWRGGARFGEVVGDRAGVQRLYAGGQTYRADRTTCSDC